MSRNVNVSDNRFNQPELESALTVPAGASYTELASQVNTKNEGQGLKVDGQDEIVIHVAVSGTMPTNSEVVITPIVHGFPALDNITVLLDGVTDGKVEKRVDSNDAIRDADFLKVTYRFIQGGADYDVTAIALQVKKKPSNLGAGGGASLADSWIFDAGTADADPGSKKFRFDNATQASATFIYVNKNSNQDVDFGPILLCLASGDRIYVQDLLDVSKFHLCQVTGNPTDATTYVKIPITVADSGSDLDADEICDWSILFCSGVTTHALGGSEHSADTLANLNSKVSDATLDDVGDARTPTAHGLGGAAHSADTLANLNSKVSDATLDDVTGSRTPTAHAASHQGGGDPITPAGIGAEPAISPKNTAFNKDFGSASGTVCEGDDSRLSDARDPNAHDIGGAAHNADTLANLNSKVSDATLFGKELFDANTMLAATSDDDPAPLTVNQSTIVGRKSTGPIAAMSPGEAKTVLALNNVTNDAQLKRAAGDIASFTEKTTPVSADLLLIEDSAAANAKKRLQIGNLPGGVGSDLPAFSTRKSGDQTLTGSYADVTGWLTPDYITSDFSFNTTTGVITINTTGLYWVMYALTTDVSTGTDRSDSRIRLQVDEGSGYAEVPSSQQSGYNRQTSQGENNLSWAKPMNLEAGDTLKMQAIQNSGTSTVFIESDSCIFNIFKMQGAKGDAGPVYTHGTKTRAEMLALTGLTAGDNCWCSTYDKPFTYNGSTWQVVGETMQMTNEASGTFVEGDICILDTLNDDSVDVTSTANDLGVVGIVVIGGANGSEMTIAFAGIWDVDFGAGVTRGYYVQTSTTAGQAMAVLGGDSGTIGVVIEGTASAGLARCWLSGKEAY